MKVALFRNIQHDWSSAYPWDVEKAKLVKHYVQVSEAVEIEFPPLANDDVVKQQLNVLDDQEQELRATFQKHLDGIKNRRAELQALTFVPAA